MKRCPFCAEEIQDAAIKCRYCGSDLNPGVPASPGTPQTEPRVEAPAEKTYYSDGAITVTSSRAVLGGKTYAMANITSVTLAEENSEATGVGCLGIILGLLMSSCVFVPNARVFGVFGILLLILGVGAAVSSKPYYIVRLGSASGEADALKHKDRAYIQTIVEAVNQAIVERG